MNALFGGRRLLALLLLHSVLTQTVTFVLRPTSAYRAIEPPGQGHDFMGQLVRPATPGPRYCDDGRGRRQLEPQRLAQHFRCQEHRSAT